MAYTFSPTVVARKDGSRALELAKLRSIHPVNDRSAIAARFECLLGPRGPATTLAVVFSDVFPAKPAAFGLPDWGGAEGNWVLFSIAAIGEFLDATEETPEVLDGPAHQIDCLSPLLSEWEARPAAEDEQVLTYLRATLWWSWKFNHPTSFFGPPDCLRLGVTVQDLMRVATLEEGNLWEFETRHPTALVLRPLPLLLRTTPRGAASTSPAQIPPHPQPAGAFVDATRIAQLREKTPPSFDLQRLLQLCEELNKCYSAECFLAVAGLTRALLDHVPPLFNAKTFAEVASNYPGGTSFKDSMAHLENSARKIADSHLHQRIRQREVLPTRTQVDFSRDLDVLLGELVRVL